MPLIVLFALFYQIFLVNVYCPDAIIAHVIYKMYVLITLSIAIATILMTVIHNYARIHKNIIINRIS